MRISIVLVTARLGGLDVFFHSLSTQIFDLEECEVIIVDEFFEERRGYMWRISSHAPRWVYGKPRVIHLPPDEPRDYYDACHANNSGLRRATGELVVFLGDNNWMHHLFLAEHWRIFKGWPGYSMSGYVDRYPIPKIKTHPEALRNWNKVWWTIYEREMDVKRAQTYFNTVSVDYQERKGGHNGDKIRGCQFREVPGNLFYGALNDSVPLDVLKQLNGWDEDYDGAYGAADIDLGTRANLAGWKFMCNPDIVNYKLGQRAAAVNIPGGGKKLVRPDGTNLELYYQKIEKIRQGGSYRAEHGAW